MTHGWKRFGAIAVPALMVAGLLAAIPATAGAATTSKPKAIVARAATSGFGRGDAVLSTRLSKLTTPQLQAQTAAQRSAAVGLTESGPGSLMIRDGRYVVDIRVDSTSDATQQALAAAGATVTNIDDGTKVITATVAADKLVAVASVAGVQAMHEELEPAVGSAGRAAVGSSAATTNAVCSPIISEGVAQLRADVARSTYSVDGTGVKVGVLSDSFNNLGGAASGVANGELPGAANPCGHTTPVQVIQDLSPANGEDEGRGMSEIVHDMAPGANLAFATASASEGQFATNIRSLASAGAKVIVDDVTYFDEPMYQDGNVAKAVNDVTAQGVSYFSSAGNENVIDNGGRNVGSYEATGGYRPTGCPTTNNFDFFVDGGVSDCHDFDPSGGVSNGDTFTVANNSQLILTLGWNEPQFNVPTDFDFFIIDVASNNVVAGSEDSQDQTFAASEVTGVTNTSGVSKQYKVVVGRFKNNLHPGGNTPRFKMVAFARNGTSSSITPLPAVQFNTSSGSDVIGPTIYGHNAAIAGATVAAVPFNDSTTPETYSSRGPATYCYAPVTGTLVAAQPIPCQSKAVDIAATDGGQTSFFFGSSPPFRFYGTSAAAPHAAGVAALERDARICATPAQVIAAQRSTGRAVGAFGVDSVGNGLIDANAAIGAISTCPVSPASTYHPVNPTRVLESRNIVGNTGGYTTPWGPGVSRSVDVTNTNSSGVPDTGVTAVVLNVTVTDTTSGSFLSVYPNGENVPVSSNLNWSPGTTIANLVTVKVGTGGRVSFFNALGSVNVIADVVGWYDDGTPIDGKLYTPTTPTRILESRPLPGN
ncbi:MAG: S8 family peptidase, partial [Acidimicrobiales bacterium]